MQSGCLEIKKPRLPQRGSASVPMGNALATRGLTFFSGSLGVWRKSVREMVLGTGGGRVNLNGHTKGLPPAQWNLNHLK